MKRNLLTLLLGGTRHGATFGEADDAATPISRSELGAVMFSHVTLGTNDLQRAIHFYDGVMAVLGYRKHSTGETFAGYGDPDDANLGVNSLWILIPTDGQPATSGNGTNVAFIANTRERVDEFHRKALEVGGVDEGRPGIREEAHPNFYAGYIRDPDGNKLVVVCHHPDS